MRSNTGKILNNKSSFLTVLENALLLIVLSLMILRTTYIENPHIEQIQTKFFLSSEIVSLFMSTALLACFAIWLLVLLLMNRFRWRKTSLGFAVGLFILAGAVSCLAASNKRAALTDLVLLATPMLSALLLIQLLTAKQKTHLAVLLVLAIAVAMTAQCIDQLLDSNNTMIQEYERNPAEQLQRLNIEQDSLEHWMYKHRLYSKDIRGFLMTSNSAASFFLLSSFAAMGICIEAFRNRKKPETLTAFVCYGLAFMFAIGGLILTQSKGGIGAFIIGVILLFIMSIFGKRLWKYRLVVGILLLIGIVLAATAVIVYGGEHGRLPGGNSMLVRWQYWQSTARMIGDHFLTGVGGGNFQFYYPLYKNPAASETIQDPHNFILSLFSQYGPLGLLAFLTAVLWPIFKCVGQQFGETDSLVSAAQPFGKKLWMGLLTVSLCLLLLLRPLLTDIDFLYQPVKVSSAAYLVLYLFPAGVFVLAFGLLCAVSIGDISVQKRNHYLTIALACGVIAVLTHNLVDFAIFETGVWNMFWLFMAILVACRHNNSTQDDKPILLNVPKRLFIILALMVVIVGYFAVAVVPPMKANMMFNESRNTASFEEFRKKIQNAVDADRLSPDIASNAARLLMQMYSPRQMEANDLSLLEKATDYANTARQRNPADFKPYRLQGDIYLTLFEQAANEQKEGYLQKAYAAFSEAMDRYPGSDRIHYNLGKIAEQLNRPEQAMVHYQKAVEIEQAYQAQFKIMYPDRRPVISRLGNTAYTIAKAKIKELRKQLDNPKSPPETTDGESVEN
ncbi:MAG: O-antigen ligase family protein [Phycisphaerae bacterium]|nr:O-antigen ligase family protein [Phycisphaerae bacterium]